MKKTALRKEFWMSIRKSPGRFLSIFLIVALGVSFFSGIRASEPDMRVSGDRYYDETNLMDLKVQKKSLDEAIGELEVRLKVAYQLSHTVRGEWINTGNHTFRVIPQSGRVTLDRKRLAEELKNLLGEQKAQTLMARCEKQGEPFGRLYAVQTAVKNGPPFVYS